MVTLKSYWSGSFKASIETVLLLLTFKQLFGKTRTLFIINTVHPPPRYLLGAALIFWGAMVDHLFIAIALALLIEVAHWFRLRWDFDHTAYIRAWQLTQLSAFALAVYIWLEGDRLSALQRLLSWLPALFAPVQLVQSYSTSLSVPLSTFSFFARRRQLRIQRLGLPDTSTRVNFGNVFLVSCMVAATLGANAETVWFLPGLLILTGWAVFASRRTRWIPLLFALAIVAAIAVAGNASLRIAQDRYLRTINSPGDGQRSPDVVETAIGSLREIKQSPDIKWRLRATQKQPAPTHLKTITYNKYKNGVWQNQRTEGRDKDFDWAAIDETSEGSNHFIILPSETDPPDANKLLSFNLRGGVSEEAQLPLPGDAAIITGFKLEKIDHNSMGTVRINPSNAIIEGMVYWNRHSTIDPITIEIPPEKQDLILPGLEAEDIQKIATKIGLREEPTLEGKLQLISNWFAHEFKYTRYLTMPPIGEIEDEAKVSRGSRSWRGITSRSRAIALFLNVTKEGHCEYFATAASLLLRSVGVPARYSVGYAVREYDSSRHEFIMRGTHAHAWCRIWDQDKQEWIDFDPTPGNWLALEGIRPDWKQPYKDWLLRIREDFALWRTDSKNRMNIAIGMMVFGVLVLIFIGRRLWKSKRILIHGNPTKGPIFDTIHTPLHELESIARDILGPRPVGLPFSRWLLGLRKKLLDPQQLDEAIHLHQRLRYDPSPQAANVIERLSSLVEDIKKRLQESQSI